MGCLKVVAIVLFGLILIFGAGFGGYAFGDIGGYNRGYEVGFDEGYEAGFQQTGYNLRDPRYDELMRFLEEDKTNENEYVEGKYTCTNFAADLNKNAEDEGFRAAYVYIEYLDGAHAIAAFETVDKGLVFIEPRYDKVVVVGKGISYSQANSFAEPAYDDTITRFVIAW